MHNPCATSLSGGSGGGGGVGGGHVRIAQRKEVQRGVCVNEWTNTRAGDDDT